MPSLRLPNVTDTPIESVVELLAHAVAYIQVSGNLTAGEGEVAIGDPIAWDTVAEKFIKYVQGGSGDETTCVGFVRIGGTAGASDVPIEVVIAGSVKYSIVSDADNWNAAVITDLKARVVPAADALLFW